jgi:hypothetical protein
MDRKNQVLDALSDTYDELDRLYQMIPEDTNPKFNLWLAVIQKIKTRLDSISNLVELEDD